MDPAGQKGQGLLRQGSYHSKTGLQQLFPKSSMKQLQIPTNSGGRKKPQDHCYQTEKLNRGCECQHTVQKSTASQNFLFDGWPNGNWGLDGISTWAKLINFIC